MEKDWYRRLGSRIARHRSRRALTQEQLAEHAGIGASYVARIETGARRPTLDVLGAIAAALGVSLDRLLADERGARAAEDLTGFRTSRAAAALSELDDGDLDLVVQLARRLKKPRPR